MFCHGLTPDMMERGARAAQTAGREELQGTRTVSTGMHMGRGLWLRRKLAVCVED